MHKHISEECSKRYGINLQMKYKVVWSTGAVRNISTTKCRKVDMYRYCTVQITRNVTFSRACGFARGLIIAKGGGVAPVLLVNVHP